MPGLGYPPPDPTAGDGRGPPGRPQRWPRPWNPSPLEAGGLGTKAAQDLGPLVDPARID